MESRQPVCVGCHKKPEELTEYVAGARVERITPDEFVKTQEGTYNSRNGHFLCTKCYVRAGMPLGRAR